MKIAVASNDGKTIATHFGRARGFVVYELEDRELLARKFVMNTFTGHARGLEGQGHDVDRHGVILEALRGCQAVISRGMGRRIHEDLRGAEIEPFIVDETLADRALGLYLEGHLEDHPEKGCTH